jgi:hypothetical protein
MEVLRSAYINLFSKIIINILFVNNCASNLLSVSKITHEINYELIFSSQNVIFQEMKIKNVIGEGFLENGLYILGEKKFNFNTKKEEKLSKF